MSFRDELLKTATRVRAIPHAFGVRPYSVVIRVTSWLGAERGEGAQDANLVVEETPVVEYGGAPPKVRWLSTEELALAAATPGADMCVVGPVTPGNLPREAFEPTPDNGEVLWVLTGPKFPDGAPFACRKVEDDRGYHYKFTLERVPT